MKKHVKSILVSSLMALAFGGMSVGSTFALFTSQAKTEIDIGSGIVRFDSTANLTSVWEYDGTTATSEKPVAPQSENNYVNSQGGITKLNSAGVFELIHWAPGDHARIAVDGSNLSNVTAKVRLKVVMQGELAGALTLKIHDNGFDQDPVMATVGARTLVSPWIVVNPTTDPGDYGIDIQFKNHGTEITHHSEGIDNQYQNKTATISITYEAVQGNAAVTDSLLERANTILATNSVLGNPNNTMYDALGDLEAKTTGMKNAMLQAGYLWGADEDQFYQATDVPTGLEYRYFVPAASLSGTYSTYAYGWTGASTVNLVGMGFDMGDATTGEIEKINYTGIANTPRSNLIRGNGNVNVEINAPLDVVKHYGDALQVTIVAVAGQSYHEFGKAKFVEISTGRVVLEKDSSIGQLHFVYDESAKQFNDIVVAYDTTATLPTFSRDVVTLEDIEEAPKLVVELQNGLTEDAESDYIWLYQEGLKEQIRVTDKENPTTQELAEAPKSTDAEVNGKTADVAEQIANNIAGDQTYEELVDAGKVNEDGSIKPAVIEEVVVETGLDEEAKEEAVQKAKYQDLINKGYNFAIGDVGYESLKEAFDAVEDNQTICLIQDLNFEILPDEVTDEARLYWMGSGFSNGHIKSYIHLHNKKGIVFDMNGHTMNVDYSFNFIDYFSSNDRVASKVFIYLSGEGSLKIMNGVMNVKFDYKNRAATATGTSVYNTSYDYSAIYVHNNPANPGSKNPDVTYDIPYQTELSMVNCSLTTNQVPLRLHHGAKVTELNANLKYYCEDVNTVAIGKSEKVNDYNIQNNNNHCISMMAGSKIIKISGGSYIACDQRSLDNSSFPLQNQGSAIFEEAGFRPNATYYPQVQTPRAEIGEISGGVFKSNGAYPLEFKGYVGKISGGLFTRIEGTYARRNTKYLNPTIVVSNPADNAEIASITGGTFVGGSNPNRPDGLNNIFALRPAGGSGSMTYPSLAVYLDEGYEAVADDASSFDVNISNTDEPNIIRCYGYKVVASV